MIKNTTAVPNQQNSNICAHSLPPTEEVGRLQHAADGCCLSYQPDKLGEGERGEQEKGEGDRRKGRRTGQREEDKRGGRGTGEKMGRQKKKEGDRRRRREGGGRGTTGRMS